MRRWDRDALVPVGTSEAWRRPVAQHNFSFTQLE